MTASLDGTARIWSSEGEPTTVLQGHTGPVNSAVFSPDDQMILTCSEDGTAIIWDLEGNALQVIEIPGERINSATFNSEGNEILTASTDGSLRIRTVYSIEEMINTLKQKIGRGLTDDECYLYLNRPCSIRDQSFFTRLFDTK